MTSASPSCPPPETSVWGDLTRMCDRHGVDSVKRMLKTASDNESHDGLELLAAMWREHYPCLGKTAVIKRLIQFLL